MAIVEFKDVTRVYTSGDHRTHGNHFGVYIGLCDCRYCYQSYRNDEYLF